MDKRDDFNPDLPLYTPGPGTQRIRDLAGGISYYRLVGTEVYPLHPDTPVWEAWGPPNGQRHIAQTYLWGKVYVSTVFIPFNLSPFDYGPPLLFETMVFGGLLGYRGDYQVRTTTHADALQAHLLAVSRARAESLWSRYWYSLIEGVRMWWIKYRMHRRYLNYKETNRD